MTTSLHRVLWSEGLDHWRTGRLEEAVVALRGAIAAAGEEDVPEYHQSLGGVLGQLDRRTEARAEFEESLRLACARSRSDSAAVTVARYFLAEHLIAAGEAEEALAVMESSLGIGARVEALLHFVRALALQELGRGEEAAVEARAAIEGASSDEQRERFAARLISITERS